MLLMMPVGVYSEEQSPPTAPIAEALAEAGSKLDSELEAQSARPAPSPKDSENMKKTMLESVYKRGKLLYDEGKYREAADVWELVAPDLADEINIKNLVQSIRNKSIELERLKMIGKPPAGQKAAVKLKTPELMLSYLEKAFRELQQKVVQSEKELSGVAEIEERQKKADAAFRQGRAEFEAGDISKAIGTWRFITPELEDPDAVQSKLVPLEGKYAEYLERSRKLAAAGGASSRKLKTPDGMAEFLAQAESRLDAELSAQASAAAGASRGEAERQLVVERSFREGQEAYGRGDYQTALAAWRRITPYITDAEPLSRLLDKIEAALRRKAGAQQTRQGQADAPGIVSRIETVVGPMTEAEAPPVVKPAVVNPQVSQPVAVETPTVTPVSAAPAKKSSELDDIEEWMRQSNLS